MTAVDPRWYAGNCGPACGYCRATVEAHAPLLEAFQRELGADYVVTMDQTGGHRMCIGVRLASSLVIRQLNDGRFVRADDRFVLVTPGTDNFGPMDEEWRGRRCPRCAQPVDEPPAPEFCADCRGVGPGLTLGLYEGTISIIGETLLEGSRLRVSMLAFIIRDAIERGVVP